MALLGNRSIRRHISISPEEESRLIAAAEIDRAASLSHWLAQLGLRRADELGVPPKVAPLPKPGTRKSRARKRPA